MSSVFPKLSSGSMFFLSSNANQPLAKYPVTSNEMWQTRRIRFLNDSEQRWTSQAPLFSGTLQYQQVSGYDMGVIRAFFLQHRGKYVLPNFSNTFSISINGQTYNNLVFDQDTLDESVDRTELFSFVLKLKQLFTDFVGGGPALTGGVATATFYAIVSKTDNGVQPAFLEIAVTQPYNGIYTPTGFYFDNADVDHLTVSTTATIPQGTIVGWNFSFGLYHSLLNTNAPNQARIYEAWAVVTYASGLSVIQRPTHFYIFQGAGYSSFSNEQFAYDNDPTTWAQIDRSVYGGLLEPDFMRLVF